MQEFPSCRLDGEWRYLAVNQAYLALVGRTDDAVIGWSLWEVCPWLRRAPAGVALRDSMQRRRLRVVRTPSALKAGQEVVMTVVPNAQGGLDVVLRYETPAGRRGSLGDAP